MQTVVSCSNCYANDKQYVVSILVLSSVHLSYTAKSMLDRIKLYNQFKRCVFAYVRLTQAYWISYNTTNNGSENNGIEENFSHMNKDRHSNKKKIADK